MRKLSEDCSDDEENFNTMVSLYCQWAEDIEEAEQAVLELFRKEYPELLN